MQLLNELPGLPLIWHSTEETRAGVEAIEEGFRLVELGRISIPEDVANVVAFLALDAASYMCGVSVDVGGGQAPLG